ncbi:hypothetical protein R0J91_22240, partial [Micrococcus sp. SIMBA_131]
MLAILLLAIGCTNSEKTGNSSEGSENQSVDKSEEAQENIKTVLKNTFTGPNNEQQEIMFRGEEEDIEEFAEKLSDY